MLYCPEVSPKAQYLYVLSVKLSETLGMFVFCISTAGTSCVVVYRPYQIPMYRIINNVFANSRTIYKYSQ